MNKNDIELLLQDLENRTDAYWRRNVSGALLIRMCRALLLAFALREEWESHMTDYPTPDPDEGAIILVCADRLRRAADSFAADATHPQHTLRVVRASDPSATSVTGGAGARTEKTK